MGITDCFDGVVDVGDLVHDDVGYDDVADHDVDQC